MAHQPPQNITSPRVATYQLGDDWSDGENPFSGGVWQLNKAPDTPFTTHFDNWSGAGAAQPAWADAPWPQMAHVPVWMKVDGTSTDPNLNSFSQPGDIVVHGAQTWMTGTEFTSVQWVADRAGTAVVSGGAWVSKYFNRPMVWEIRKNGEFLTKGLLTQSDPYTRTNPFDFAAGSGGASVLTFPVASEDTIELLAYRPSQANYPTFVGVNFSVDLTTGLQTLSVPENRPVGTAVGLLQAVDPDLGDTHTFALVNGQGDGDNPSFAIDSRGRLVTAAAFDHEAKSSYTIRVRATDQGGLAFEKVLAVSVTDDDEPHVADLSLETSTPEAVVAGQQLTYMLVVTNRGPSNATGVTVASALPAGVTYVSATPSQGTVAESAGTLTVTLGNLAVGAQATIAVIVDVSAAARGTLINDARVSGNETETNLTNNEDRVSTQVSTSIDLAITKTDSANPVTAGGQLIYTLDVTNHGPSDATGVTVTDTLPMALRYLSGDSTSGTVSHASQVVTAAVGDLAAGESATITLVTQVDPQFSGTLTKTAAVTGNETESNTNNNLAEAIIVVTSVTPPDPAPPLPPEPETSVEDDVTPPDPPDPAPKGSGIVARTGLRFGMFALSGAVGSNLGDDGANADHKQPPAPAAEDARAQGAVEHLCDSTAAASQGLEQAEAAILASDPVPFATVAFDLGDELPVERHDPRPPEPPEPPDPPPPDPPPPDRLSATKDVAANGLFRIGLPMLLAAAAGVAWHWRRIWPSWFARGGRPVGFLLLAAVAAVGTAGQAAEPPDPYLVLADAKEQLARGEYRQAGEVLAEADRARQYVPSAKHQLARLDLLADVQFASGQHSQAEATRQDYQKLVASAAYLDDALRARKLRQSGIKLAEIQASAGRLADAERTWQDAWKAEPSADPADPLEPARGRLKVARAIVASGGEAAAWFAEAERHTRRVLESLERGQVERVHAAEAAALLAECCGAGERWAEAVAALDRLLEQQGLEPLGRRAALCERARYQHAAGDYAGEQVSLGEALHLVRNSAPDESLEMALRTAEIWDRLGHSAQAQQDRPRALEAWENAAAAYWRAYYQTKPPRSDGVKATIFGNLREVYLQVGDEQQARDAARATVELLGRTRRQDDPEFFSARARLGGLLVKAKEYHSAELHLKAARKYWEKRQPAQTLELVGVLNSLGELERDSGDMNTAAKLFDQAFQHCQSLLPADDPLLAEVAVNLGAVAAALGDYDAARDWYEEAIRICGGAGATPRAVEVAQMAYLNLATSYRSQGRIAEALRCSKEPPPGSRADMHFHYAQAALYLAQAEAKSRQGEAKDAPNDALAEAIKHADLAHWTSEAQGTQSVFSGELAYLRGCIRCRQEEPEAAKEAWDQALQISRSTGQVALEARVLTRLCEAELRVVAQRQIPQLGTDPAGEALRQAALNRAEVLAQEAIERHNKTKAYPSLQFSALVNGAQIFRAQHIVRARSGVGGSDDLRDKSAAWLREAVDLAARLRTMTTGADYERAQFFSQYALAFDLLVDWCVQDGKLWEALQYAEASRNRTFLDQMRAVRIDFDERLKGDDKLLLGERSKLLFRYAALRNQAVLADGAGVEKLARELDECCDELWKKDREICDRSRPVYEDVLSEDAPLTAHELRQIASPGDLVLLYHLGARRSHLFVWSRDDEAPLVLSLKRGSDAAAEPGSPSVGRAELGVQVQEYLKFLRTRPDPESEPRGPAPKPVPSEKTGVSPPAASTLAKRLTQVLLPTAVRERLTQQPRPERLIIVPDGVLHELPFEALMWPVESGEANYVLDHAPPIAYAPSLQVLRALRKRDIPREAKRSLLTVGKTEFPGRSMAPGMERGQPRETAELDPLPATRNECQAVEEACRRAGFSPVHRLLDADATEQRVRNVLEQANVLHFATHAWEDPRDNCFGALVLTRPPALTTRPDGDAAATAEDDGLLEHHEIYRLSLARCELAVLSACRTNIGPHRPLEASSTLSRTFLVAGAQRVVCSLWAANDDAAFLFVQKLFENLERQWKSGAPVDYAAALHEARKHVRQTDTDKQHPYYWAPFILIGPAVERSDSGPPMDAAGTATVAG